MTLKLNSFNDYSLIEWQVNCIVSELLPSHVTQWKNELDSKRSKCGPYKAE